MVRTSNFILSETASYRLNEVQKSAYRISYQNMAALLKKLHMKLQRCPVWDEMQKIKLEHQIVLLKRIRSDMKLILRRLA